MNGIGTFHQCHPGMFVVVDDGVVSLELICEMLYCKQNSNFFHPIDEPIAEFHRAALMTSDRHNHRIRGCQCYHNPANGQLSVGTQHGKYYEAKPALGLETKT
jgi:hypothetical protein